MSHIVKSFREFEQLFESESSPNKFETDFPDKWKKIQDLGFYDVTTPIMRKNGSVLLKNDKYNDYPGGIVFQNSGYIRNKLAKSGFIKKGLSWEKMADYIIDRYTSYKGPKKGYENFSPSFVTLIRQVTKAKISADPQTGRINVDGSVHIIGRKIWEALEKEGIKFGVVREFSLNLYAPPSRSEEEILTAEDLEMFPTLVKTKFSLSNVYFPNQPDFSKFPEARVGLDFHSIDGPGLKTLKGLRIPGGCSLEIRTTNSLETVDCEYPDYMRTFSVGNSWSNNLDFGKITKISASPKRVKNFGFCGTSIKNLVGCPEVIEDLIEISNNPYLESLEGLPKGFKGKIKTDYFEGPFSIEDRIEMLITGIAEVRYKETEISEKGLRLIISSFGGREEEVIQVLQKMVDENPEKMAVKFKSYSKFPIFQNIQWPKNLQSEFDLLSDLGEVGL